MYVHGHERLRLLFTRARAKIDATSEWEERVVDLVRISLLTYSRARTQRSVFISCENGIPNEFKIG